MSTIEIWWIGIALAMDCFAVSIASGIRSRRFMAAPMLAMVVAFGLFQGGLFVAGYAGASLVSAHLTTVGKWIAVGLLAVLGAKMVWDDLRPGSSRRPQPLSLRLVPLLAVATSMDALAVGVSFSCMPMMLAHRVAYASAVIAFCSSLLAATGLALGIGIGERIHFPTSFVGGIILLSIAIKMVLEYFLYY